MLQLQTKIMDADNVEELDISELKIYYDTETKQYKKKFTCDICGEEPSCMCYNDLEDAFSGAMEGFWCRKCALKNDIIDDDGETVNDIHERIIDSQDQERIAKFESLLAEQPYDVVMESHDPNRIDAFVELIINLLSEDEFKDLCYSRAVACSGDFSGAYCK
jgi:transcription elongation factor Elf1